MVDPLKKRDKSGLPYTRFADIESKLVQLVTLPDHEVVARCILGRDDESYVPTECLLHLLRRGFRAQNNVVVKPLFETFLARLRRAIPLREKKETLVRIQAFEQVQDRLVTLLSEDANVYQERLDFFEVQFKGALATLLLDANRQAQREHAKHTPLGDEETGEIDPEVEKAAGTFHPFDPVSLEDEYYRSVLDAAMEKLPLPQKRIIEMIRMNMSIESQDPEVVTISKVLGVAEKTVRNRRNKAIATIKRMIEQGEQ
jgi:DNA-directed RNA polymerase specialized sigma24 family protein